jgi:hypothetical protein
MFIIKLVSNHFLKKEKENILCLAILIGDNFEILDKGYVIDTLSMDSVDKSMAGCSFRERQLISWDM